jgi:7-cyano-7-deazaguanine reductase
VTRHCSEFTCRCPITGEPDWARIEITYRPRRHILESKSLKLYLETFREEGIFHEHLATTIREDLVTALDPTSLQVKVCFNSRGGIAIDAASHYPEATPDSTEGRSTGFLRPAPWRRAGPRVRGDAGERRVQPSRRRPSC